MSQSFSSNWLQALPEDLQAAVRVRLTRRVFRDQQLIMRRGESTNYLFQVASGRVRIRAMAGRHKESVFVLYGPTAWFGYFHVFDGGGFASDAVAEGPTEVLCLATSDFEALNAVHPEMMRALGAQVVYRLRELYEMYLSGQFLSLRAQLARQVDFLLSHMARHSPEHDLQLDLTQESLAASVCATRQAVGKVLREWADQGLVEYGYRSLRVLDREGLRAVGNAESRF